MKVTKEIKTQMAIFLVKWFSGAYSNDLEALADGLESIATEARRQAGT